MKFYETKIIDIVENFEDVKTYTLEKPDDLTWEEGACMHVALEGFKPKSKEERLKKEFVHHYSILNLPEEKEISFSTRFTNDLSIFKSELLKYKVGDKVTLFKIHSRMKLKRQNKDIIMISMGIGIVTYRTLALSYLKDKSNINKLVNLNVSTNNEFLLKDEFDSFESDDFKNIWTNNRHDFYNELSKLSSTEEDLLYYIVGSDVYIENVIEFLLEKNVNIENIHIDKSEDQKYIINEQLIKLKK